MGRNGGTCWKPRQARTVCGWSPTTCAVLVLQSCVPWSRFHSKFKSRHLSEFRQMGQRPRLQPVIARSRSMKHAIITSFLGKLRDRFCEYQQPLSIEEKLERMARIPGVTGAEVVHPYEVESVETMRGYLQRLNLEIAAINVNIKADPIFAYGSLSSPDPEVRRKAAGMMKAAKDYAKAMGADKVTCCPLSDGYDYPFHTDYRKS